MLHWRTLPYPKDKFFVKGTELAQAIVPGFNSRYAVVEVRTYDKDRNADRGFSIRDAATVSDKQVKDGIKPKQIAFFNTEDELINFIQASLT